jgi:glycosyltransferase involved in cell wall biosynthesis
MLLVHEAHKSLTMIIPCHRYEHWLPEAINSVLSQGITLEIIVVDDLPDSHPTKCEKILHDYPTVKRIETNHGNPLRVRQAGFDACDSEYVCFLDADDKLGEGYIEEALQLITTTDVIYSDIQYFGNKSTRTDFPNNINPGRIALGNFMHVGCVTKRKVIEAAHAFNHPPLTNYHEDWYFWRKIITAGFSIKKQRGLYHARQHDHNRSTLLKDSDYYQTRGTAGDSITLCNFHNQNNGEFRRTQTWPKAFTIECPNHVKSRLDYINHILRTAWTDFIFFYNENFCPPPSTCEYLLRKMNSQAAIIHSTDFAFLDCTIIATPMIRGKAITSENDLKQLPTIYV